MPSSARIVATASGWVMYGSPLRRVWPSWNCAATWYARSQVAQVGPRVALRTAVRRAARAR